MTVVQKCSQQSSTFKSNSPFRLYTLDMKKRQVTKKHWGFNLFKATEEVNSVWLHNETLPDKQDKWLCLSCLCYLPSNNTGVRLNCWLSFLGCELLWELGISSHMCDLWPQYHLHSVDSFIYIKVWCHPLFVSFPSHSMFI